MSSISKNTIQGHGIVERTRFSTRKPFARSAVPNFSFSAHWVAQITISQQLDTDDHNQQPAGTIPEYFI